MAPSQCNKLTALLASMNKTMAAMSESLLGKGATCSGKTQDTKTVPNKHESMNEELLVDCIKKHKLDESDPAIVDHLAKIIKLNKEQLK